MLTQIDPNALYTTGEAARAFGVSTKSIRNYVASGKLPEPIRTLGRHRRFNGADLLALHEAAQR